MDQFHNQTAADLGRLLFEAQARLKSAQEDLAACKLNLIGIAKGAKMDIEVPFHGRVMVFPAKPNDKKRYTVDAEKFDKLDFAFQQLLLVDAVVQEAKKSDEPVLPAVLLKPL